MRMFFIQSLSEKKIKEVVMSIDNSIFSFNLPLQRSDPHRSDIVSILSTFKNHLIEIASEYPELKCDLNQMKLLKCNYLHVEKDSRNWYFGIGNLLSECSSVRYLSESPFKKLAFETLFTEQKYEFTFFVPINNYKEYLKPEAARYLEQFK